jgi:uncharacterized protein
MATALIGLLASLSLESLLPPSRQPSARTALAAIRGYQAIGSPAAASLGVRCRYTPTCSHYATAAIGRSGTLEGLALTAGRIWRCSPWGGAGYDPATASPSRSGAGPGELLIWLFPMAGFVVYFFSRPDGRLAPCPTCSAGRRDDILRHL